MNWLNAFRKATPTADSRLHTEQRLDVPLFPLAGVLFPGGIMSLKVFEQRYLDMAATCMRARMPFGVCLIASGREVGTPAVPHPVGTLAHIDSGDMPQLGILVLKVRGGRRFRIVSRSTQPDGLLRGELMLLDEPAQQEVPLAQQGLLPLLRKVASDLGPERCPCRMLSKTLRGSDTD